MYVKALNCLGVFLPLAVAVNASLRCCLPVREFGTSNILSFEHTPFDSNHSVFNPLKYHTESTKHVKAEKDKLSILQSMQGEDEHSSMKYSEE